MNLNSYQFPVQLAGNLCLNFTNTIEFRESEACLEFLHSYDQALAWCHMNDLISESDALRLEHAAMERPGEAEAAFHAVLDLRETLYRIFTAVIADQAPAAADLARLNQTLAPPRQIAAQDGRFQWRWVQSDDFTHILAPIALAAAELLTSNQLQWVHQCPNCGWLFLDTSRNHSRRWCSMDFCGSQVKSRRQYERRKRNNI